MKRKNVWLVFIGILLLAILAGVVDWPNGPDIQIGGFYKQIKVHLGLDLQGGTSLLYQADVSKIAEADKTEAIDGVRDVIERRVNAFGVSEPVVQTNKQGDQWRVIVELPGISDVNQAIAMIGETPLLEFKKEKAVEESAEGEDPAAQLLGQYEETGLTGKNLKKAEAAFAPNTGEPEVSLEFDSEGKDLFAKLTEENVGKTIAIFLDGSPISIPTVDEPIKDGKAVISGNFTIDEAKQLARRLNSGALPVPISLISQQNIGPTLGKVSVEKSLFAGLVGLAVVVLFMIVYYRLPGLMASIALVIYSLVILAIFKLWPVVLTLAGIAGFILSIGMAVDANVLIFERTKEEVRRGKSLHDSIEEGFKRAWTSIRDSNISSLITCLILIWFGTSLIKGFAITLAIGVLVSMFSAITITRTLFRLIGSDRIYKHKWLFGIDAKKESENNQPQAFNNQDHV